MFKKGSEVYSGSVAYKCLREGGVGYGWECRLKVVKKGIYSGGMGRFWVGRISKGGGVYSGRAG